MEEFSVAPRKGHPSTPASLSHWPRQSAGNAYGLGDGLQTAGPGVLGQSHLLALEVSMDVPVHRHSQGHHKMTVSRDVAYGFQNTA
jgi:hypothetical protein